jgi:ubiquinone/menaquinone biosynthesis C-methylase UbiE
MHPGGLRLTERAARLVPPPLSGKSLLDVGCGRGDSVAMLADVFGVRASGVDVSEDCVREGRALYPDADLSVGDALRLPFGFGAFDIALFECVLSVVTDSVTALTEARRVLSVGGTLIVSDVTRSSGRAADNVYTREGLVDAIENAGFWVTHVSDHTGALVTYSGGARAGLKYTLIVARAI